MTVGNVVPRVRYTGSGTRGPFDVSRGGVPIPFRSWSHILVDRVTTATGARTRLTYGVHYSGAGSPNSAGWYSGATITLDAGVDALAATEQLDIRRAQPLVQDTSFVQAGNFPSAASELAHDRMVTYVQDRLADLGEWLVGAGAPGSTLGDEGQLYINSANGDVWGPKTDAGWGASATLNIIGPTGPPGGQPLDPTLTAFATTLTGAGKFPFATGPDTISEADSQAFGRSLLNTASALALRALAFTGELLVANRTYYVRTNGSDSNDGLANTAGGAFLTLQKAWDVSTALSLGGSSVTIQAADGTYTAGINATTKPVHGGEVFITGNIVTPGNVLISASAGDCFEFGSAVRVWVSGMRLANSGGSALHAYAGGVIIVGASVEFGACSEAHFFCDNAGQLIANSGYKILGAAPLHYFAHSGGLITVPTRTVTLTGTPAIGVFAFADIGGIIEAGDMTFVGSATGQRFLIENGGVIQTNTASLTYFPGDVVGQINGGWLDNRRSIPTAFTPTYLGVTTAGSTTYGGTRAGTYWRDGDRIHFSLQVSWTAATGTGQAAVGALPYSAAGTVSATIGYADGVTAGAGKQLTALISNGESRIRLYAIDPAGGAAASVLVEAAGEIYISGSYVAEGVF